MSTVPAAHPFFHVQAFYSTLTGLIIREDGRSRPCEMDEVEQTYGQAKLDSVMENPCKWVDLYNAPLIPVLEPIRNSVRQLNLSLFAAKGGAK